jgi:histidinol-phosphate aminotransferase
MSTSISRRSFAGILGGAAGVVLAEGPLGRVALAAAHHPRPTGAILLNSNENPYGPPPKALEAAARATHDGNRYPDALEDEMRAAIARHHGVPVERVVLGCGSSEILRMADAAFTGPTRNVVAAEPTFEAVLNYARALHTNAVKVPLTADFRHDLVKMAAACGEGTGLVYVCNPNNPTGTIVSLDALEAFAARVPKETTILVDEAYHHFVEDASYGTACGLIAKFPNVVVARTFSKIYGMAGLRLGYAIGTEERIAELAKFAAWNNTNAAVLSAGIACLADSDLVAKQRKLLNDTRRWLVGALRAEGRRVMPSETNFVMVEVGKDVGPLIDRFRERKILVGRKFPSFGTWLRVSIGTPDETRAFHATLGEIVPASVAA